jgi:hypothetical protein
MRPKTTDEWRQIIDSAYARRDAEGLVCSPNWAVMVPRFDDEGEWAGEDLIDIVPALPNEIAARRDNLPSVLHTAPVDQQALAARIGYSSDCYEFTLDHTGCYTAAFIRLTKEATPRGRVRTQ